MSKPLYELTEAHLDLARLAEENEDMAQSVADTMEGIEGEFEDKAVSLIHVVNNMDGDIEKISAEIKRLTDRQKVMKNRQGNMREYLRSNMEASGITKIQCPLFTITLAKGKDMVQIDDADALPTDYVDFKTISTPIKADILSALKAGEDVAGASLVKSKTSLRIK